MTKSIELRLEALEKKDKLPFRVIARLPGETGAQAKEREGVEPEECVVVIYEGVL